MQLAKNQPGKETTGLLRPADNGGSDVTGTEGDQVSEIMRSAEKVLFRVLGGKTPEIFDFG